MAESAAPGPRAPEGTTLRETSPQLDWKVLAGCLARSYLVGAAFNHRSMQAIGLTYALEPALQRIHTDPARLAQARTRYLTHYNTHPFFTPLLMGIFLFLEGRMARGELPEDALENVRTTTIYSLSAIGDSVFGGGVLVLWGLSTACLLQAGQGELAVALGLSVFIALQVFKAFSLRWGLTKGMAVLSRIKALDLINWGRRIKVANAALLVLFWSQLWPDGVQPWQWLAAAAGLGSAAYACRASAKRDWSLPRGLALIALFTLYLLAARLFPWLTA